MKLSQFASLISLATVASALTPAEWRSQSIYQVVTDRFALTDGSTTAECDISLGRHCGGTWQGIINKLDYIQGMGFTAIWISPVVKNYEGLTGDGEAYMGFWHQNLYEVNDRFGTADDLKALSQALHDRGMYLMVDVATNHMAAAQAHDQIDYSVLQPFNDSSYYHSPFCRIDWSNGEYHNMNECWLGSENMNLVDLRTEDKAVQDVLGAWVADLVKEYSIDGLRLDAAKHLSGYLGAFQQAASTYTNGTIHVIGEVNTPGDYAGTCAYQGGDGITGIMDFGGWNDMIQAFASTAGDMQALAKSTYKTRQYCEDPTVLGSFIENQDEPRFASRTADMSLTKNVIGYNMLKDGIPINYYGQEQQFYGRKDPYNREALWTSGYNTDSELYKFIARINAIRNHAIAVDPNWVTNWGQATTWDKSTVVMKKGTTGSHTISVFSNLGHRGVDYVLPITYDNHFFGRNAQVVEMIECVLYTTDANASLNVNMTTGLPRVFYPASKAKDSGICPDLFPQTKAVRNVHGPREELV